MRTLQMRFTLTPSMTNADWISTFFVFQKGNGPGKGNFISFQIPSILHIVDMIIVIGLLDNGCVKLWAFDPRSATTNVMNNRIVIRILHVYISDGH